MFETEYWRDIPGHPNYQASDLGNIRSKNYHNTGLPKNLNQSKASNGYMRVSLPCGGKPRGVGVHRLVASAWIPNPSAKSQVNHKNGDKEDNRVENLEWVSPKENSRHAADILQRHKKKVLCVETGKRYNGVTDAASDIGGDASYISKAARGGRHSAYGYHWRYIQGHTENTNPPSIRMNNIWTNQKLIGKE